MQDTFKILLVVLDRKLTFKTHIKEQLKKAFSKVSALRRLRKFISRVRLYKAYVLPHLEYGSPLLLDVGNVEASKMENTNYFILRSILNYPKSVSYEILLQVFVQSVLVLYQ